MTDVSQDPDDLVGQVVERAATKVADAASTTVIPDKIDQWIKLGVIGVLIIIILGSANLILNVQTKNAVVDNQNKVEALCKIAALSQGAQQSATTPIRVAECLK